VQSEVLNNITPVAVSQAINTQDLGNPNPQPPVSLTILTKALPNASTNTDGAYSQQLMAIGGVVGPPTTNYTWTLVGDSSLPPNLTLSPAGVISGTPTTGGTYNFIVQVADAASPTPHVAQQALSILVIAPLLFTPPANESLLTNQSLVENLATYTSGGLPPYQYAITGGSLPAGFTLDGSTISGTSSTPVSSSFTVGVTDALNSTVSSVQTINVVFPLSATAPTLATAFVGQPYSALFGATGGTTPYTWSVSPPTALSDFGLSLNAATGQITGSPTLSGTINFSVTVTDSSVPQQSQTLSNLSISVHHGDDDEE
jgi:hypothetical protein